MENFDYIEMTIPAKAEYIGVIRWSLSGIASRMGFSYEDIEDLKVQFRKRLQTQQHMLMRRSTLVKSKSASVFTKIV